MKKYLVLCNNRIIFISIHIQTAVTDFLKILVIIF